jgi:hypothetical protein
MRSSLVALLVMVAVPAHAQRQQARGPRPELKIEGTTGRPRALQMIGTVAIPLGNYVRLGLGAGGGVARVDSSSRSIGSARGDVTIRFLLDPYRESRWGLSAGGGLTVRHEEGYGTRGYLAILLDLEAPPSGRLVHAIQVGLGGGARVGLVVRGTREGRR